MAKRNVPTHPQGWKFAGSNAGFIVWHAGKSDYRVTNDGVEVAKRESLGQAHSRAAEMVRVAECIARYGY